MALGKGPFDPARQGDRPVLPDLVDELSAYVSESLPASIRGRPPGGPACTR